MAIQYEKKIGEVQVGSKLKVAGSALVSNVKEIAKDTADAAGGLIDDAKKGAVQTYHKVEKKLS